MKKSSFLRDRRKEIGLTMKEVADFVGVSEASVSRWETGDIMNMRRDRVELLAKILRVSPLDILNISNAENNADLVAFAQGLNDTDAERLRQLIRLTFGEVL